ncbi:12631_t:CDS:2 [Dentiscutata erythropus]|uniref:12631_t:CDS:1 n=1 Tax=Dentiscutata erythropus TaxID=1348616 RepID=A0A9N8WJD2_9GLOM|nr:12631_t:CDS:2 [Dentiscutata erythropus]
MIPQDSELDIQKIDYDKNVDIRMVPLVDFTTNKIISDIGERKFTSFIKNLISPSQYSSLKEEDYSPFIKIIMKGERDIIYENPSIEAVMNWTWYCSNSIGLEPLSISFDSWSFWPLTIISIVGGFMFAMILQNVIISFMSDAFSGAVTDSKRGVYRFQIDYIHEFALLEKSLEFNNLDSKFKDKIRAKYICFQYDP